MNKKQVTPEAMMAKAAAACRSARLLLENGDADGATNRAYYAMFDAARAALLLSGAPVEVEAIRTHGGLIGAFGKFLVKDGPISKELGSILHDAFGARLMADYDGDFVEPTDARIFVEQSETFIAAIHSKFMPDNSTEI